MSRPGQETAAERDHTAPSRGSEAETAERDRPASSLATDKDRLGPPQPQPFPNVTVAASANRTGTVQVRATDQGMPVEIKFERSEYRYGAQALAAEILRLTKRSAIVAKARRRELLAESGMPAEVLDKLGLPTRQSAVDELDRMDDADTGPTSWMRPV